MLEVNIDNLINENNELIENIPDNISIIGKINELIIRYKYDKLDLFKLECNIIKYVNQEGKSTKNHILPNSLKDLYCRDNQLTSLPKLPNSLEGLHCQNNRLTSLPNLPNSLQNLYCSYNQLTSLPNLPNSLTNLWCSYNKLTSFTNSLLPNSLQYLDCNDNELTSFPDLPNSLQYLSSYGNQLISLPNLSNIGDNFRLIFYQNEPISYIPYNSKLILSNRIKNKILIKGYPYNPITNQDELDEYMEFIFEFNRNKIKSARN